MWYAPFVSLGIVWAGAAFILLSAARKHRTSSHTGQYMPAGNPWRIGSTVLIAEDLTRPEENWFGTVLSTNRDMVTIRDNTPPYHAVETEKQYVYRPDAIL